MSNFEFRRDADGKPQWHNPLPNEAFDSSRPYKPDNSPFSICALCGEPWPCSDAKARTDPVPVTGIWLRSGPERDGLEVLAEINGEWRTVITEKCGGLISYIVEPLGMRHARPDRLAAKP